MVRIEEHNLLYEDLLNIQSKNGINLNITQEWFDWLYYKNPYGKASFYCAFDNTELIGIEILIPVQLIANDTKFLSALAVNSLIDKNYRGQGIWKKLLDFSEEQSLKKDIKLIWGFPNDNSYPILIEKQQWKILAEINSYISYLNSDKKRNYLVRKAQQILSIYPNINSRFYNNEFKTSAFNNPNKFISSKEISIFKSPGYFLWRYVMLPEKGYIIENIINSKNNDIVGSIVFFIDDDVFYLFDLIVFDREVEKQLPLFLQWYCKKMNCRCIFLSMNVKGKVVYYYKKNLFINKGKARILGKILDKNYESVFSDYLWKYNLGDEEIKFVKPFINSH